MPLALDFERIPDVPKAAVVPLFAALLLLWLLVRVVLLRGRLMQRMHEENAPRAPRWLMSLAQKPSGVVLVGAALTAAVAACLWAWHA